MSSPRMSLIKSVTLTTLSLSIVVVTGCASIGSARFTQDPLDDTAGLEPAAAQVQALKPCRPEEHNQFARAALMGHNIDKANLEVKLGLQDNPLDAESHFLLGCLLARKGENDQAIVGFQRALAIDPTKPEVSIT
jgi:Flp pilus assembly protein TadD